MRQLYRLAYEAGIFDEEDMVKRYKEAEEWLESESVIMSTIAATNFGFYPVYSKQYIRDSVRDARQTFESRA